MSSTFLKKIKPFILALARSPGRISAGGGSCLGFCRVESFAPLVAVTLQRVEDDGISLGRREDLVNLDGFSFELLVVLKESPQHEQAMRRHSGGLVVRIELGILRCYRDNFVVLLARIDHGHQSNRTRVNDGQRN